MSDYTFDKEFQKEFVEKFVEESKEFLDSIEQSLLTLSKDPVNKDEVTKAFRNFHSLKGNAGMLGFDKIEKLAHFAEEILEQIKDNFENITDVQKTIWALFDVLDLLKNGINSLSENDECNLADSQDLLDSMKKEFLEYGFEFKSIETSKIEKKANKKNQKNVADNKLSDIPDAVNNDEIKSMIPVYIETVNDLLSKFFVDDNGSFPRKEVLEILTDLRNSTLQLKNEGIAVYTEFLLELIKKENEENLTANKNLHFVIEDIFDLIKGLNAESEYNLASIKAIVESLNEEVNLDFDVDYFLYHHNKELKEPADSEGEKDIEQSIETKNKEIDKQILIEKVSEVDESFSPKDEKTVPKRKEIIRVELGKLDSLIDLVGELVIAGAMVVSEDHENERSENFDKASENLSRIIREIQELSMEIRMVPIGGVFNKIRRLIHDLSRKSGKKLKLTTSGEETEVDKSVVELISDPLVHLIRNSVDHGIEDPKTRIENEKAEEGLISLEASHVSGEVRIKVTDDGRGLSSEKIFKKALEKKLISGNIEEYSKNQIYELVFKPGFSTADKITNISGRGVGMDVVKKNIEKLKGSIELSSVEGKGTTIMIKLPLTLAIMDGLLVQCGSSKYVIPLTAISQTLVATNEMLTKTHDGDILVNIMDKLYPVYKLYELHNIKPQFEQVTEGILVLIRSDEEYIALLIDEIIGQESIVVKGLSEYIGNIKGISGCSILGNGDICLILDVNTLVLLTNKEEKLVLNRGLNAG